MIRSNTRTPGRRSDQLREVVSGVMETNTIVGAYRGVMRYNSIQSLRCLAVVMVLTLHSALAVNQPVWRIPFLSEFGYLGVSLFFVISGFIIADRIGRETSFARYAAKRYLRILPLYVLFTFVALLLRWGHEIGYFTAFRTDSGAPFGAGPYYLLKSIFIVPQDEWPVFMVGWSLEYEVTFYLIFGAAYFLAGRRAALAVIPLLIVAPVFFPGHEGVILDMSFSYFVFGYLAREAVFHGVGERIAPAFFVFGAILSGLHLYDVIGLSDTGLIMTLGLTFSSLVVWCVAAEKRGTAFHRRGLAEFVGDISFSLYLSHWFVIAISRDLTSDVLFSPGAAEMVRLGAIGASFALAYFVWRLIERPLNRAVSARLSSS